MKQTFSRGTVFSLYISIFCLISIFFFVSSISRPKDSLIGVQPLLLYSITEFFLLEMFVLLLIGSLLVGLSIGKAIAYSLGKSFQAVHHLEGHLYSPFLAVGGGQAETAPETFLGLVVSGGHTSLFQVEQDNLNVWCMEVK